MERGFAVIGLGYVGLPVALALANNFAPVIGFDISKRRIVALREWKDTTGEVGEAALRETKLRITDEADALKEAAHLQSSSSSRFRLTGPLVKRTFVAESWFDARDGRRQTWRAERCAEQV